MATGTINVDEYAVETTVSNIITPASGISISSASWVRKGNIAMLNVTGSKSTAQSAGTFDFGTLVEGKRPRITAPVITVIPTLNYGYIQYAGAVRVNGEIAAGTAFSLISIYILQ